MKYSKYDLILVATVIFQFFLILSWSISSSELSIVGNLLYFFLALWLAYFNPIVVTHNFLHTPFFREKGINHLFTIFNSMNLGLPQIIYKYHHLNHHRHNNSVEDPSSTYLYGKNGQQENWIRYSALGLFRDGTQKAWKLAIQKNEGHILYTELAATIAFWGLLLFINWKFFLLGYVPLYVCGWFLAHVENYFEHYKASNIESRFGNSVSYYPRLYNLVMFNEGYHQEHHISPQEHWTKRPETKAKYSEEMKKAGGYHAKFPPLLGMFE